MMRELVYRGRRIRFDLETVGGDGVRLESGEHRILCEELAPGCLILQNSKGRYRARVVRERDHTYVWLAGHAFEFQTLSSDDASARGGTAASDVRAPMPGTLIKLLVKDGDAVEEDQVVAVLEAMKMEHQLRAPRSGKVMKVNGTIGAVIGADAIIVTLEPAA